MTIDRKRSGLRAAVVRSPIRWVTAAIIVITLGACAEDTTSGGSDLAGTIRIDGSSTVAPLSETAAELFQERNAGVQVIVGTSGTGGGFEKFCKSETDIADASRAIKQTEAGACKAAGVVYQELAVANDGLSVVVNPDNKWARCMTVAQLKKIWDEGSRVRNWKDVDPSFPNEKLELFGPGTDSGTFDYFTEAINGKAGRSRTDYNATEDDNVTVRGVSGSKGALGYFGLSYLEQNDGEVKGVKIDGGNGCVAPSTETVQSGEYKPLSRPLFIYASKKLLDRPEGEAFVSFYVENTAEITQTALFVDLNDAQKQEMREKLQELKAAAP